MFWYDVFEVNGLRLKVTKGEKSIYGRSQKKRKKKITRQITFY